MKQMSLVCTLLFVPILSFGQEVQTASPIFLAARTAQLIVEVIGAKSQNPSFNAEINRILRCLVERRRGIAGRPRGGATQRSL
jgi:hypothetical protein